MTEHIKNKFDLSIPRRKYYRQSFELSLCPECGSSLIQDSCTIIIVAKSDTDEGKFLTNLHGSHFCESCPVVVFNPDIVEQAARLGIKGDENLKYFIEAIVNLNAIPPEKKHLEIGTNENPIPIVHFLSDLNKTTYINEKKIGRNEPCPCGSGKKYKKCCG